MCRCVGVCVCYVDAAIVKSSLIYSDYTFAVQRAFPYASPSS